MRNAVREHRDRLEWVLQQILARAVATCEREGTGIEDTDDMIAIRELAEAALGIQRVTDDE